ncbi:hypothetical protein L596_027377 [Steinernema carpocapsae]|uniref:Uncharacterized protein n=1 Tax=Steinernema carpocapsae TaxID=34508 RepID=A0A4U5M458_STECR|nr:hypothetical protein L596_027377 [Steinernema carpocapsae]
MDSVCLKFCSDVLFYLNRNDHVILSQRLSFRWAQSAFEHLCKLKHYNLNFRVDSQGKVGLTFTRKIGIREGSCSMQEYCEMDKKHRRISSITIDGKDMLEEAQNQVEIQPQGFNTLQHYLMQSRCDWDSPALSLKLSDIFLSDQFNFFNKAKAFFGELTISCPKFCDSVEKLLQEHVKSGCLRKLTLLGKWPKTLNVVKIVEPMIVQNQMEMLKAESANLVFGVQIFRQLLEKWRRNPELYGSVTQHGNEVSIREQRRILVNVDFSPYLIEDLIKPNYKILTFIYRMGLREDKSGNFVLVKSVDLPYLYKRMEVLFGDVTSTIDSEFSFVRMAEFAL